MAVNTAACFEVNNYKLLKIVVKVEENSADNCVILISATRLVFCLQILIFLSPSTKCSAKGFLRPALAQGKNEHS